MAPAVGEVQEKAPPRPKQELLITESLRWAPTVTTRRHGYAGCPVLYFAVSWRCRKAFHLVLAYINHSFKRCIRSTPLVWICLVGPARHWQPKQAQLEAP